MGGVEKESKGIKRTLRDVRGAPREPDVRQRRRGVSFNCIDREQREKKIVRPSTPVKTITSKVYRLARLRPIATVLV